MTNEQKMLLWLVVFPVVSVACVFGYVVIEEAWKLYWALRERAKRLDGKA